MIISVQIKDASLPRSLSAGLRPPRPDLDHGLLWAMKGQIVALGHVPPRPRLDRIGLISVWESEQGLDAFLARSKWDELLDDDYAVRLRPLRTVYGSWSALPELDHFRSATGAEGPVAALTLGRLRLTQSLRFLRADAKAQRSLRTAPGLLAATGVARPPLLSTFSLWRDLESMRAYASTPGGHRDASAAHRTKPFHHEAIFVRLAPYESAGTWDGVDPLAQQAGTGGAASTAPVLEERSPDHDRQPSERSNA